MLRRSSFFWVNLGLVSVCVPVTIVSGRCSPENSNTTLAA
jgi:hypothetical protein